MEDMQILLEVCIPYMFVFLFLKIRKGQRNIRMNEALMGEDQGVLSPRWWLWGSGQGSQGQLDQESRKEIMETVSEWAAEP